jgi:very-short-patch-repair endonuclease
MPNDWSLSKAQPYKPTTDADRAAARLACCQWNVLTTPELHGCGLNGPAVGVRVRRGYIHPLYRAVYAWGTSNLSLEGHWLAAVKACGPHAVLSHYAAACLWCLLKWDGRRIDVTAPTRRRHQGIRSHRSDTIECVVHRGIPVTPRLRTIVDLAKTEDERTVTRALRAARFSERELAQLPRGGMIGRIVNLSAAPTASHPEDYVLDLILKAGFKHPEVNRAQLVDGRRTVPDLRWPEVNLIIEVDSREWHSDPLAQRADAIRQARLEAEGWRVLRVTEPQAKRHPQLTIARFTAAGAPS